MTGIAGIIVKASEEKGRDEVDKDRIMYMHVYKYINV